LGLSTLGQNANSNTARLLLKIKAIVREKVADAKIRKSVLKAFA
jgi:hypothetical protein